MNSKLTFVFIRGVMPRSGTNFLADVLSCHPDICRDPSGFWEFAPFRFQDTLDKYLRMIEESRHASQFHAQSFLPYMGKAWEDYLSQSSSSVFLLKEPSVDHLESMMKMFPEAKVVFAVRDGRDLITSLLKAGFAFPPFSIRDPHQWRRLLPDEDFRICCRKVQQAAEKLNGLLNGALSDKFSEQYKIVFFESMFDDPEKTVNDLLSWIGLSLDRYDWDRFKSMPVQGSSFLCNSDRQINFKEGVPRPSDFNPVGRWAAWSDQRKAYYTKTAGVEMKKLGYED